MSNPMSIKQKRLPKHVPKYPDEVRNVLIRFLAAYLKDVRRMLDRTKEQCRTSPYDPGLALQLRFWDAAESVVRDMARRVHHRQRHLVDMDIDAFIEQVTKWGLRRKS